MLAILMTMYALAGQPEVVPFDVVIANGRVIDPESTLDAVRHIGIRDGKIAAVSDKSLAGKEVINAQGLVVSPGFIDLHSHAQTIAGHRMQAFDGVTTSLELESGLLPVGLAYERTAKQGRPLNYGFSSSWAIARQVVLDNVKLDGDVSTWKANMAGPNWQKVAQPEDSKKIIALVEQGLKEGALGVGMLLGYAPDSNVEEYYEVAKLAKRHNVPVFTHIRHGNPRGQPNSLNAHEELIAVAAMTGAHIHICHLNSTALRRIPEMLDAFERARLLKLRVTAEAYPYGAGSTVIGSPFLEPASLPKLDCRPSDIVYLPLKERIRDAERLAELRKKDPGGIVVIHLLREDDAHDMKILNTVVTHPETAIASDAMRWQVGSDFIMGDVWPLPERALAHPRSAGCFTRVIGRYVREKKLTLAQAIRKCSLLPAQILEESVPQMKNKGRIRVGADADIVVLDPERVADRATYEAPNQTSIGMRFVLVNGNLLIKNGELLKSAFPGRPVRR